MKTTQRYQTFSSRFLAGIVDSLVFIPVAIADAFIITEDSPDYLLFFWIPLSYASYSIYSVLMHAKYGQTLGKMCAKVKVLNAAETDVPGLKRAFLRDSIYIAMTAFSIGWVLRNILAGDFTFAFYTSEVNFYFSTFSVVWLLLEFVTMLTNSRRRALHDFIGGTVVVNKPYLREKIPDSQTSGSSAVKGPSHDPASPY
ncbi:RDD family protein [Luteolibacter sp. AS25]|uniref:RDD family protein n=1 Tax=Luteolibacter sp. AS25 TaxID=3135776 RepID=UPI00398B68DC